MSTEEKAACHMLRAIEACAVALYPFPDGSKVDPRLSFALGQIAGIAAKALADVEGPDKR